MSKFLKVIFWFVIIFLACSVSIKKFSYTNYPKNTFSLFFRENVLVYGQYGDSTYGDGGYDTGGDSTYGDAGYADNSYGAGDSSYPTGSINDISITYTNPYTGTTSVYPPGTLTLTPNGPIVDQFGNTWAPNDGGGYCGDGVCNNGETSATCPGDCGGTGSGQFCGDGVCNNGETSATCPADCGTTNTLTGVCGDGICGNSLGESCDTCPADCGTCKSNYPDCNSGPLCGGACTAPVNTCNANNGTRADCFYYKYTDNNCVNHIDQTGRTCNPYTGPCIVAPAPDQPCTKDTCSTGYVCTSGVCTAAHTISGIIFNDANKNGKLDSSDTGYNAGFTVTVSPNKGTISYVGSAFTINNLPPDTYTITYNGPPTSYVMTEPKNNSGLPSFNVIVGPGCSVGTSKNAVCDGSNNIQSLDFGINNNISWVQFPPLCEAGDPNCTTPVSIISDWRNDNGISTFLPNNGTCGGVTNSYAAIDQPNGNTGNVLYSGDTTAYFGASGGTASSENWVVGGTTNGETFTPVHIGQIRTAYAYILANAQQAGTTQNNLNTNASACPTAGTCSLSSLSSGLYLYNGNLTLNASNITAGNYVLLVNGDLTINGNITVANGATLMVSVSGNIHIANSVGEASSTSRAADIEGLYSSDQNIILDSVGNAGDNCTVNNPDKRVNVLGSFVTNAAGNGGTLINNRDMCAADATCPVFSIGQRPDFLLDMPDLLKHPNTTWQEVAP